MKAESKKFSKKHPNRHLPQMSEKWTEKLDEILLKLNKLDSIETTLNNLCAKMTIVESDVSKLKDGAHVTEKNLKMYSRRENLKFFGLAERETKSNQEGSKAINTQYFI